MRMCSPLSIWSRFKGVDPIPSSKAEAGNTVLHSLLFPTPVEWARDIPEPFRVFRIALESGLKRVKGPVKKEP